MAKKVRTEDWTKLQQKVAAGKVPLRAISYQELLSIAINAASFNDQQVLVELDDWICQLIAVVKTQPGAKRATLLSLNGLGSPF
jgi:hypothetical protein